MKLIKKLSIYLLLIVLFFTAGWFLNSYYHSVKFTDTPVAQIKPRPLDKYTINNLNRTEIEPVEIVIDEVLKEEEDFSSYLFSYSFDPSLSGNDKKTVTGQINIPAAAGKYPVVVMFRGYVDPDIYRTGVGTLRASEYFAKNGFITIAPDFLGYAGSSENSDNIFGSRFQTYTTGLVLLQSLQSIEKWDGVNVFLWGHSNGGQIAITILEITQREIPTTLWAPVTKSFPYSILYYTDHSEDRGKFLRRELARFEETYDVDLYSIDNYLDRIKAPLMLHQGTNDSAVPRNWSDEFTRHLSSQNPEIDITYHVYTGADHNLNPSWNLVITRDLSFFRENLVEN